MRSSSRSFRAAPAASLRIHGLLAAAALSGCSFLRADAASTVPFTWAHGLIFVEVGAPDGAPLLALLDTGANASAIDPRRSAGLPSLGASQVLGTTGAVDVENVLLEGLRLGGLELADLRATRRDLGGLLAPPGRAVEMILGSDAFVGCSVTIDYGATRLEIVEAPRLAAPPGAPLELDAGIPWLDATIGGVSLGLRIDTGASLFDSDDVYVNVPPRTWTALCDRHPGLLPSTHFEGTGADGRTVELPVAPIAGARIGGVQLERVFVIVQPAAGYFADPAAKGFVGNNFLRTQGRVTLDYANGRFRVGRGRSSRAAPRRPRRASPMSRAAATCRSLAEP